MKLHFILPSVCLSLAHNGNFSLLLDFFEVHDKSGTQYCNTQLPIISKSTLGGKVSKKVLKLGKYEDV